MTVLDRLLGTEDVPPLHQCGRECTDGSPCRITTATLGEACHHHDAADPRVDGGPEDASEVPLSGASSGLGTAATAVKGVVAAVALTLGFGTVVSYVLAALAAVVVIIAAGVGMNAYQRRAYAMDAAR